MDGRALTVCSPSRSRRGGLRFVVAADGRRPLKAHRGLVGHGDERCAGKRAAAGQRGRRRWGGQSASVSSGETR